MIQYDIIQHNKIWLYIYIYKYVWYGCVFFPTGWPIVALTIARRAWCSSVLNNLFIIFLLGPHRVYHRCLRCLLPLCRGPMFRHHRRLHDHLFLHSLHPVFHHHLHLDNVHRNALRLPHRNPILHTHRLRSPRSTRATRFVLVKFPPCLTGSRMSTFTTLWRWTASTFRPLFAPANSRSTRTSREWTPHKSHYGNSSTRAWTTIGFDALHVAVTVMYLFSHLTTSAPRSLWLNCDATIEVTQCRLGSLGWLPYPPTGNQPSTERGHPTDGPRSCSTLWAPHSGDDGGADVLWVTLSHASIQLFKGQPCFDPIV